MIADFEEISTETFDDSLREKRVTTSDTEVISPLHSQKGSDSRTFCDSSESGIKTHVPTNNDDKSQKLSSISRTFHCVKTALLGPQALRCSKFPWRICTTLSNWLWRVPYYLHAAVWDNFNIRRSHTNVLNGFESLAHSQEKISRQVWPLHEAFENKIDIDTLPILRINRETYWSYYFKTIFLTCGIDIAIIQNVLSRALRRVVWINSNEWSTRSNPKCVRQILW